MLSIITNGEKVVFGVQEGLDGTFPDELSVKDFRDKEVGSPWHFLSFTALHLCWSLFDQVYLTKKILII